MVVRHRQQLDLPVVLEPVIEVRDTRGHEPLPADDVADILTREPTTRFADLEQPRVRLHVVRIDPGEVEPHGQVDEVVVREQLAAIARRRRELEQAEVLLVAVDDVAVMDREEAPQHVLLLLRREVAVHGAHRDAGVLVVRAARVLLELIAEAWHHREVRLHLGELLEQPRHVEVIL